ncbi:MAG: 23S rRNA (pseudouridine(1915)-N(3))-methyltransferase RlmH [Kordiimonadaceae bacterium]|jgi:23S rRNA (pseudouridine1915-N3)-methyltransferase|nr:23S rRNA (pseudouridine(1915)-N(3))-methyltransferase RlmH [Kordiimonadaceae bacterium]MBT6035941.1 23S rRNA (pseudouridine(1915)-N(3))-methyltransferase RlmH [Kordiimonadaceae bacterium]MBT6329013.1 23S rRNA (pseudouridine(1915)-N(3))-methyltransferase RlmH [Kordiimonadaceae bacterium]MBT7583098.1 23S rRNA (pseudouridine(1915)-N(3))-methyltransferase RlmH [Kordiimonadaceae bacterium]
MNIIIIAVGRMKKSPENDLISTYIKRCPWNIKFIEVEEKRPLKGSERMDREGALLLGAIPDGSTVIVLDERGTEQRSTAFAKKIENWQDQGISNLVFLIGGADGFDEKVKSRANGLISLGVMTWPHMMVRAMLCEQLYRASTILAGHPYHKD